MHMTGAQRFLAACRRQPVDTTPVWFMGQAGRCIDDYRRLRERYEVLDIARNPELCAQVSSAPVDRFGVDAAVMFTDIMLVLDGMGVPFRMPDTGPVIERPVRTEADVDALRVVDAEDSTPFVFEAITMVREQVGDKAAVIGIAGSPFTLACYLIEGGPSRDYRLAKAFMLTQPDLWHRLMEKLTEVTVRYYRGQVAAGSQATQYFESWVGVLSPQQYETFVLPYARRVFDEVRKLGVPSMYLGTGNASLLELMAGAGSDVMGLDWRVTLDGGWRQVGYDRAVHGNLDPTYLLASRDVALEGARDVLARAAGRPGHIFTLGHNILPGTDADDLAALVELVHAPGG